MTVLGLRWEPSAAVRHVYVWPKSRIVQFTNEWEHFVPYIFDDLRKTRPHIRRQLLIIFRQMLVHPLDSLRIRRMGSQRRDFIDLFF